MNRAAPSKHEILAATAFGQVRGTQELIALKHCDDNPDVRRLAGIALGLRSWPYRWWRKPGEYARPSA
ncbi:hypothetical protein [Paracoccus sp. SSK6]|uniref:hypothetical protein n=1 Tax=Paracoccus sp. SSK6 TaxID=3143131 RepID=UPI003218EB82